MKSCPGVVQCTHFMAAQNNYVCKSCTTVLRISPKYLMVFVAARSNCTFQKFTVFNLMLLVCVCVCVCVCEATYTYHLVSSEPAELFY